MSRNKNRVPSLVSRQLRISESRHGVLKRSQTLSGKKKNQFLYEEHISSSSTGDNVDVTEGEDEDHAAMDVDVDMDVDDFMASHAGGEIEELIAQELRKDRPMLHPKDTRDRRDRTLKRNLGFSEQLNDMVDRYLLWSSTTTKQGFWLEDPLLPPPTGPTQGMYEVTIIDTYGAYSKSIPLVEGDKGIAAALVGHGFIPCAPYNPQLAITIRTLELFRFQSLRCARFAIQNFVESVLDMHGKPYKQHIGKQFSICQDVYLSILAEVDTRVQKALGRDSPQWRLEHACPPCNYPLKDEKELEFGMLITMDGNGSLKRIPKREPLDYSGQTDEGDIQMTRVTNELLDDREVPGDYYVPHKEALKWLSDLQGARPVVPTETSETQDDTPCSERWKNMSSEKTGKSWSIFEETGVFVSLCRHGTVLVLMDMIRSGEGSQYALALVEVLIKNFGARLGVGYDIGCRFQKTLARSGLGQEAKKHKYTSLVGSFHGHAHNRLCQLVYLATYRKGLGLSDLEGAERLFSKTNDLAASTRHSSTFHRRQRIVNFLKHLNETDIYEGLSSFIVNHYKRAKEILVDHVAFEQAKTAHGITDDNVFEQWLSEEKAYLLSRMKEPPAVTHEIDYLQTMEKYNILEKKLASSRMWSIATPSNITNENADAQSTAKKETERRHNLELSEKHLLRIQELEMKLRITERWVEGDENWVRVQDLVVHREYQNCLDKLEKLVVERVFELGKMNQSGMCYKLREHVSNGLKTRSTAIRTALDQYNRAAQRLTPPREKLEWSQVVEYAFISEFELLASSREDIRQKPWAGVASRALLDKHFKMQRAQEEIERLEIEIPRFLTFMRDEEVFLEQMKNHYSQVDPPIAHQIHIRQTRFILANQQHRERLQKLAEKYSFSLSPGVAVNHISGSMASVSTSVLNNVSINSTSTFKDNGGVTEVQVEAELEAEAEGESQETRLQEDLEMILGDANLLPDVDEID